MMTFLKQFKLETDISQLLARQMGGFYLILSERQPEKAHEYFLEQAKILSESNLQEDAIESINKSWISYEILGTTHWHI
jgi:hypothetical protein